MSDEQPKAITVQRSVMRMEKENFTFPSKVDPPVKCCRCFPNSISSKGYCGCCDFDHATGVQGERFSDPDYDEPKPEPENPEDDPEQ